MDDSHLHLQGKKEESEADLVACWPQDLNATRARRKQTIDSWTKAPICTTHDGWAFCVNACTVACDGISASSRTASLLFPTRTYGYDQRGWGRVYAQPWVAPVPTACQHMHRTTAQRHSRSTAALSLCQYSLPSPVK